VTLKDDPETYPKSYRDFLTVKEDDIILAYVGKGCIAYVGKIVSNRQLFNDENVVGKSDKTGGFDYPNQKKVRWFSEPHHFDKKYLPSHLVNQIKGRQAIIKLEHTPQKFESVLASIQNIQSNSSTDYLPENLVKSGIRSYVQRNESVFEPGLKITIIEKGDKKGRPDFAGFDRNGNLVLIECKGNAKEADCDQLIGYTKRLPKQFYSNVGISDPKLIGNTRIFLVAFDFSPECIRRSKKDNIELVTCQIKFTKQDNW
jgi:hypothetical protein